MRISEDDKALIKGEIGRQLALRSMVNQSEISRQHKISRVTVKRWIGEIRQEQLKTLDKEVLEYELWRLSEIGRNYVRHLEKIHYNMHYMHKVNHGVELGLIRTAWNIDKETFQLKLDLFSRLANRTPLIDQKIGIAVNVNQNQ